MKLYGSPLSPYVMRVLLVARAKASGLGTRRIAEQTAGMTAMMTARAA